MNSTNPEKNLFHKAKSLTNETAKLSPPSPSLLIGWGQADITPSEPVYLAGQFHARISQGIMDPVTATALAIESPQDGTSLVLVSCDLSSVSDQLRDTIREQVKCDLPELDSMSIIISSTHTHAAPLITTHERHRINPKPIENIYGLDFGAMAPAEYMAFAAEQIARAIQKAWMKRTPGTIAYGLGFAVVGHNRLPTYHNGESRMYGTINDPEFSHLQGGSDPSLHVMATYEEHGTMTGLVVNLAATAQVSENAMQVSADFWHETREELRSRFGADLFVLGQNAPAGDQSPHLPGNECRAPHRVAARENPEVRMWRLANRTQRQEIGIRIANAVEAILPLIEKELIWQPILKHHCEKIELPRRIIPKSDADEAQVEVAAQREAYQSLIQELSGNPALKQDLEWSCKASRAFRLMRRNERVIERFELQKTQPNLIVEVHAARLGDVAFASNPFELYLDYGLRIQARTKAVQAFLIQLAGPGSYLPTERSIKGGGYGSVPASTEVGPDGGRQLVEWTVKQVNSFWQEN